MKVGEQFLVRARRAFRVTPEQLERLRPINDHLYGPIASRLQADIDRGLINPTLEPRRFAFTTHLAVVGLLTYRGLGESSGDPLKYTDEDLLDELCQTHLARLAVL